MRVYKYKDYDAYLRSQRKTTDRKRHKQWVTEEEIDFLAKILARRDFNTIAGLCHGTRSGREQRWMMEKLIKYGARPGMVIGSELHPGEIMDPLTFEQDFNQERPDWEGRFSFIYSNSFDHAFDPEKTLKIWSKQIHEDGIIILEHTKFHVRNSHSDPTGGRVRDYTRLFAKVGIKHFETMMYKAPGPRSLMKRYFLLRLGRLGKGKKG